MKLLDPNSKNCPDILLQCAITGVQFCLPTVFGLEQPSVMDDPDNVHSLSDAIDYALDAGRVDIVAQLSKHL